MKSSLLILCILLYSMASELPLNKTKVQMNWKEFRELSTQKIDTVVITPKSQPPVGIILEKGDISFEISDSTGAGKMELTYVVLSEEDWVEKIIFPTIDIRLSDIKTEKGDVVVPTDSGYVLIAKGRTGGKSRSLIMEWNDISSFNRGVRSFPLNLPKVSTGSVIVKTTPDVSNVILDNSAFIKRVNNTQNNIYYYSLPRTPRSTIQYIPPVEVVETKDTVLDTTPIIRETQITTDQNSIHFISDERILAISELILTVNHAPIVRFTVKIPQGLDILAVEGNGINRWNLRDSTTIDVELTFELSGNYHLNIAGEFAKDSLYTIKPLSVPDATREKGKIAIALEGAGEAHFTSLDNGTPLPRNQFISTISKKLRTNCSRYKRSVEDILLSAEFTSSDFHSTVKTRRHEPATVTNAVIDSGEIYTALTKDFKSITTAQYFIRQRNRQFIELSLPNGCELWSVLINDTEVTPYTDDAGSVKIPLQRFGFSDSYKVPLVLSFTYYEKFPGSHMSATFDTPLPNIPINKLSWSLFYPEEWVIKETNGDYSTYSQYGVRKKLYTLSQEQQLTQYNRLQSESTNQKMNGKNKELPLMGLSPNYLVGKRIIIVNEKPQLTVSFIEAESVMFRKILLIALFLIFVIVVGITQYQRRR